MTPNPLYDAEEYENRQGEAQAAFEAELETLSNLALESPSLLSPCSNDEGFIELARWASTVTPTPQHEAQEPVSSAAKGAIMGAAYDFRDAHISGSMNLKRSAHAALEAAVDHALTARPSPAAQGDALDAARLDWLDKQIKSQDLYAGFIWQADGGYEGNMGLVGKVKTKGKMTARQAIDAARAAQEDKSHDHI